MSSYFCSLHPIQLQRSIPLNSLTNAIGRLRCATIVQENLCGSREIIRIWGAASSARVGVKVRPVGSALDYEKHRAGIRTVRQRRGFSMVLAEAGSKALQPSSGSS